MDHSEAAMFHSDHPCQTRAVKANNTFAYDDMQLSNHPISSRQVSYVPRAALEKINQSRNISKLNGSSETRSTIHISSQRIVRPNICSNLAIPRR